MINTAQPSIPENQPVNPLNGKKAIVIGSGIAGLATSIRLAKKGYRVQVFEANHYPGGKLTAIEQDGFRFDAGPSLFTMPQLVEELFELCGEATDEHFRYKKLDLGCRYFYEDGTTLNAWADKQRFAAEVEEKTTDEGSTLLAALEKSGKLYKLLAELFMYRSLNDVKTFLNKKALKAYANLHEFNFFSTMNGANEKRFSDPRLVQLFNRYATYNGSDPYQTPATMNIIPHLEYNIGAFFPEEGMHSITMSLFELARRQGVDFSFNAPAEEIVLQGKGVRGVKVNGETHTADVVVSNMDMVNTYRKLLKDYPAPRRLLKQPKSSSALIFYWGINRQFPELDLHNIFFSGNYKEEFDYIFSKGAVCDDPTVYVNITSKEKPDDAPEGCENWFTMINVPNNSGQDWDELIADAKAAIIKKLSRMLGTPVEPLIVTEDILDPRLIEQRTSSVQGALYGNSSNNKFAAFLRHANASSGIKNLFFCGGSVHPGGGIPLCLLSAKITADQVAEKVK